MSRNVDYTKGILNPSLHPYEMTRVPALEPLSEYVEFFWDIRWNLPPGETHTVESLPAPTVHIVFDQDGVRISGPMACKRSHEISGEGRVFGVKFWPWGFATISGDTMRSLKETFSDAQLYFGEPVVTLWEEIRKTESPYDRIQRAAAFFEPHFTKSKTNVALVKTIFQAIEGNPMLFQVEDLAAQFERSVRAIQRLFHAHIGISPKATIQLYRLREAAHRLENQKQVDLATLALDLGYTDQSHFSNHFKRITGKTPHMYRKQNSS